jgi:hypothetical protein
MTGLLLERQGHVRSVTHILFEWAMGRELMGCNRNPMRFGFKRVCEEPHGNQGDGFLPSKQAFFMALCWSVFCTACRRLGPRFDSISSEVGFAEKFFGATWR